MARKLIPVAVHAVAHPRNPSDLPPVTLDIVHSPFKMLAQEELVQRFVNGESFNPIHMRIGIVGACNMRCNFCNFHSPNEKQFYDLFSYRDRLSTDQTVRLFDDFAANGGRAVTLCGSGENTLHPGFQEICARARQAGLKVGLITNGARLHLENVAQAVIETHTWVRIGMNAGTEETFNRITHSPEGTFPQILAAIRRIRTEATQPEFRIGLNYVITEENWEEIALAGRLARDSGAHYIRYEPEFYSALGHETIESKMAEIGAALTEAATYETDEFEVSIPKLDRGPMDQLDAVEGDFDHCHYSRFVTAVGADGNLYPCPQVHLNSRYKIGSVVDGSYAEVLEGGARAEWEASNPLRTDLCKSCFYRPQNEMLEMLRRGQLDLHSTLESYRIEVPETMHADFI